MPVPGAIKEQLSKMLLEDTKRAVDERVLRLSSQRIDAAVAQERSRCLALIRPIVLFLGRPTTDIKEMEERRRVAQVMLIQAFRRMRKGKESETSTDPPPQQ